MRGLNWQEYLAYLDDVVVLGSNFSSHVKNLSAVLNRFEKYNLKLKPQKCDLFKQEIKFLGRQVSAKGISVTPDSTETIQKWPCPKDTKQLESFIWYANYHRSHIKNCANSQSFVPISQNLQKI